MTTLIKEINDKLADSFEEIVSWRRYMHQHPELSFKEEKTALYIREKLVSFGLEVETNIGGGHGLIGILRGAQPGKTIALRADFDALPIEDEKDVPYKSQNPGVMHACGHDGHTAALLGTAKVLNEFRDQLKGNVVFIFQPAEETPPGGAKFMVEAGVLDGVDYVFGAHLDSQTAVGKVTTGSGYQMAAVDKFTIKIQGKGGHGARPHESIDSIVIGSEIVGALQKVVSRRVDPLKSAVVTIGVFQAGSAFNVIADKAVLEGTVRTFNADVRKQVEEQIRSIVAGITAAFGAAAEIDYLNGYPALYNHPRETETVRQWFMEEFSSENVMEMEPSMGAEDFSYFLLEKPGTYFRVGSQNEDAATHFPHHHPKFDIDERALLNIGRSFVKIVSNYLL
ncbi:amidohydrolase [Neobacillus sp. OS1-32]|uniref:Amidohydrolase n=1 Tax=Neobacillus paridis TaxID=2803862 RepID=A0ABS1TVP7_9BACI|nr:MULTISPECIES: amidohydrolase [Neobacillus]MBL4954824.1 amidohydrolase [Neobacillus paridis]WML29015.1 amidohydrolase [Neobacillus sp. OS1-32]